MVGISPILLVVAARAAQIRLGSSFRWLCSMSRRISGLAHVPHNGDIRKEQEVHQPALGDLRATDVMPNIMIGVSLGFQANAMRHNDSRD